MSAQEQPATNEMTKFHEDLMYKALEYHDRGWSMFPTNLRTKKPLIKWREYQTRQPTIEEIEGWFTHGVVTDSGTVVRYFNLALVTGAISGFVVVDCDNADAVAYAEQNGLTSPFAVRTTRGRHNYFRHPKGGVRYANKAGGEGKDWPDVKGLDFRGDGGYVVAPPSVSFKDDVPCHQYTWEIQYGLDWDDDLPMWGGRPSLIDVTDETDFSFDKIDLRSVSVQRPEDALPIREQLAARVASLGRKLRDGDGRNQWLIRFAGEMARKGCCGEALYHAGQTLMDDFFDEPLDEIEFRRTLQSAEEMDRRNHPDDYIGEVRRDAPKEPPQSPQKPAGEVKRKLRPVYMSDAPAILTRLEATRYIADPMVVPGTITQIVGFNGHGKSYFASAAAIHMARGVSFAGLNIERPAKVLYLDWENPGLTIIDRMTKFSEAFGDAGNYFAYWAPSLISDEDGGDINPDTDEGRARLAEWINEINPDVVILDTVRSAFRGLDENKAHEWAKVNTVLKLIRNTGRAVVFLHHRNKPGESGLGREAGSTAQLTDVDTQVMVTSVYQDEADAKEKAGLHDATLLVYDSMGRRWTPWEYLTARMVREYGADHRLCFVTQTRYGKVRQFTDNHVTTYIGWTEDLTTGKMGVVSTLSPMEKARAFYAGGMAIPDVAKKMTIPASTLRRWLEKPA